VVVIFPVIAGGMKMNAGIVRSFTAQVNLILHDMFGKESMQHGKI